MKKKFLYQIKIKSVKNLNLLIYIQYLTNSLNYIKINQKQKLINYSFAYLPMKRKIITVLKSPHVYKKAQEHFEFKKYSAILTVCIDSEISGQLFKAILLNKPLHVTVSIIQKSLNGQSIDDTKLVPLQTTLLYVCDKELLETAQDKNNFKKNLAHFVK